MELDKPSFFRPAMSRTLFTAATFSGRSRRTSPWGTDPDRMGSPLKTLTTLPNKDPALSNGLISAEVLHIDRFGNVILNVPAASDIAAKLKEGNLVKISIGHESFNAPLVKTYGDVDKGRLLLVYGGSGLLEIGMNQGSAARQLKVEPGATVYLKP